MENYKEKYENLISRLKKAKEEHGGYTFSSVIDKIVLELKESENERIRKGLIKGLSAMRDIHKHQTFSDDAINIDDAIAWLEKQGEKFIPEDINEAALQYVDTCAVDGEVTRGNITEPYWNNHSMMNAYKAGWLEKQGKKTNPYSGISFEYNGHIWGMCAREGGVDILCDSQLIKHIGKQGEQKPAWSEEDEKTIDEAISLINMLASGYGEKVNEPITFNGVKMINDIKERLRNLHQKPNHWKPSDYDISLLEEIAKNIRNNVRPFCSEVSALEDLIKNIKTL